ncbi:DUF2027 domain-containing protein [Muribaculaceae bacterium Isolate-113 (HZI)]|jgi:hypothetical protein|uniref:DUF2027 domain-containing protein n=1 Tax=Barnesiella sp. CU968 TaxID=2780099 RepID=UPI000E9FB9D4|nr:DUF2027 domain-containing protein [Barnesiella sp. CU968]MBJ2192553.1 DUF2027 domain-containing protein [Muribaculaceae bacterium]ROS84343.1 DUF2027 domain-containing protein [Muribaculaceae bacterium Isolate-036 (Harlan)]ROT19555.1 DUF2027 domain-containing protein [Muribaculaceae bacterium Isolate-113 (HZI)]ROT23092.1 DUF2027 domain-containing protein [Muribaculaceae bacterium Isolate-114 (HZI)]HBY16250.1 hypothetical protein [Porphyromonadaceae bacterium]
MAKIGDTVRFLNTTGGGKITKIEGRIAYVEEDGFETPVLLNEVVVVLPAGHEPEKKGARMMFDQKAFDDGKKSVRDAAPQKSADSRKTDNVAEPELPVEETEYGEDITVALVFEPENAKALSTSRINAALVNDSNYFLYFSVLIRDNEAKAWKPLFTGEVAPNEMIDLASFTQQNISEIERVVFQAMAYKKGKSFQVKYPLNVSKKIDLTKFFKAHCFRPGVYLDTPCIEIPLYSERR